MANMPIEAAYDAELSIVQDENVFADERHCLHISAIT